MELMRLSFIALAGTLLAGHVVVHAAAGPTTPIAHAGADQTVEGGTVVTLDATSSWDADGGALTFTWVQTEGPSVSLDATDPAHPTFTAPTPGSGGVPAENQVLAFEVAVSNGTQTSDPSQVRVLVLKPFDPIADGPAVVTNTLVTVGGSYPAGSLGYALAYANTHPGTRVTFDLPATASGYNAVEGVWQFPHSGGGTIPMLRFIRGVTLDGFSQRANAQRRGEFANPTGPAILIPGVIMEFGHYFVGEGTAERTIARGLIQEMVVWNANDLVLSGNYYNVHPRGDASLRGAWEHVGLSSGGTTCGRLMIRGGTHIRVGGSTPEERNLIGGGCPPFAAGPYSVAIRDLQVVGNYFGVDRTGSQSILDPVSPSYPVTVDAAHSSLGTTIEIGGVEPGSGNVISGFHFGQQVGLLVQMNREDSRVAIAGNRIGTDATGTFAIPNGNGLVLQQMSETGLGPQWVVGGPEPGAGNILSGNNVAGLDVNNQSGSDYGWRLRVQGNFVGTSPDGQSAIPNRTGMRFGTVGFETLVGGAGRGEGNTVSGNHGKGMYFSGYKSGFASPPRVMGNRIGVAVDGVTPLGNGGAGVATLVGDFAMPLGGVGAGEGNIVAFNGGNGYQIELGGPGVWRRGTVRGNSIHSNGALGISLRGIGTTPLPNNPGDAPPDSQANDGRNYPEILSAETSTAGTTISGRLDTIAGLSVTLDFYANTSPDPSGFGEGERYIGSHSFVAGAGPTAFTALLPDVVLPAGTFVTSTTTDAEGNSSEFSGAMAVTLIAKAPSATVVTCVDVIYNASPQTTCTANVTGAGGLDQALPVSYTDNVNAGTASASASYAGDANHEESSASTTFNIAKAPSVTAVTCADVIYNGSAQTPCAAGVTGIGGLDQMLTVSYTTNVDAGTAAASASYAGDANHEESSASTTFKIAKAPSVTAVTCADVIYNRAAQTPCAAGVTGIGGLDQMLTVSYTTNVDAGTASASASYAGDANHEESSASTTFKIAKAPSVTAVTCADVIYNGSAQTPCAAGVTGIGGLDQTVAVSYTDNVNVGTASASASYAGDINHQGSSAATTFAIAQAPPEVTNTAPVCSAAAPLRALWPPNHRIVPIDISGVTDADGDAIAIRVDAILQDEPTNTAGDGNTTIDGGLLDGGTRAWVRAERSGTPRVPGDGRLYEIFYTASDGRGGTCTGVVTAGVPHDIGRAAVVDSGVRYDSTTGARVR